MDVVVRRTGQRRYGIAVRREGFPDVEMHPAPSYHSHLPHDVIHFVVEVELGLRLGVFGQLAQGGHAGTFLRYWNPPDDPREARRQRRRSDKRGARLLEQGHDDVELSEQAAVICEHAWLARSPAPELRRRARTLEPYVAKVREQLSPAARRALADDTLGAICERLDALSLEWRALGVGDEFTLAWPG